MFFTALKYTLRVFIFFTLLYPVIDYAAQVTDWTEKILLDTLSLNYRNLDKHLNRVQINYDPTAWDSLQSFIGDQLPVIRNNKLQLHPRSIRPIQLITQEDYAQMPFWQLKQTIKIPELKMNLVFSLVVIKAKNPPFLIQSLNVTKVRHDMSEDFPFDFTEERKSL